MLGATGAFLRRPARPALIPSSGDCHRLVENPEQSVTACATASGSRGTVTGTVAGQAHAAIADVWRRDGTRAVQSLTVREAGTTGPSIGFAAADVMHDGNVQLVALLFSGSSGSVTAADLVNGDGVVVVHLDARAGGNITLPAGTGVAVWSRAGSGTVHRTLVRYRDGAWRVAAITTVERSVVPAPASGFVVSRALH